MRKPILIAATVIGFAAAGLGGQMLQAQAQQAAAQPAPPPEPMPPHPPGHFDMHAMHAMHEHMMEHFSTFALLRPPVDRHLSGADVQKIAEGFLLWNGKHDWKITGVTEQDDATVGFNVATPSGDVIARFTMDRHTGRLNRVS